MKKLFVAAALAVTLAQPATAITFPSLTTIYVGSGVYDDGATENAGTATSLHCSNVSGQNASVRVLIISSVGSVLASLTDSVSHGRTVSYSTHLTTFQEVPLATGAVTQGVVNIEATQSGVFCSAMIVPAGAVATGVALHLVRVNPHPGTVE